MNPSYCRRNHQHRDEECARRCDNDTEAERDDTGTILGTVLMAEVLSDSGSSGFGSFDSGSSSPDSSGGSFGGFGGGDSGGGGGGGGNDAGSW